MKSKLGVPAIIKTMGGTHVHGDSVNELVLNMMSAVMSSGTNSPSRNGTVTSLPNVEMTLTNPARRHLNLVGRSSNIFQLIAESFWVLSGKGDINKFLKFFIPRAPQYSDDGETWRGAYGPRIYAHGQLDGVVETFRREGKYTRRALLDIYQSEKDAPINVLLDGIENPKDIPCNDMIFFWIDPADDSFHMKTVQRSGDTVFGAGSINMFEFTFMQEMVFSAVQSLYPEIKMGYYHHNTMNLHVYDFTRQQCVDAVNAYDQQRILSTGSYETFPCVFPDTIEESRKLCHSAVEIWEQQIAGLIPFKKAAEEISKLRHGLEVESQLTEYMTLITAYICSKVSPQDLPNHPYTFHGGDYNAGNEYIDAVEASKFRKFEIASTW